MGTMGTLCIIDMYLYVICKRYYSTLAGTVVLEYPVTCLQTCVFFALQARTLWLRVLGRHLQADSSARVFTNKKRILCVQQLQVETLYD